MPLAQAMLQARCQYGMHMDMNPGHTGLEFYNVAPTGTLPDLGRPLDRKWEAESKVPHMEGWSFRARRMVRFMGLMNFPRYIQREARDFLYLTLRPVLPGADVDLEEGVAVRWRTTGLPQHGFPYAVATAHVEPDASRPDTKVLLIKLDPRMVKLGHDAAVTAGVTASAAVDAPVVLSMSNVNLVPNQPTLWMGNRSCAISSEPVEAATAVVSGLTQQSPGAADAVAALGVDDEDGMLVYAEVQEGRRAGDDAALLTRILEKLGCSSRLLLTRPLLPSFGGTQNATEFDGATGAKDGSRAGRTVQFVRIEAPGGRRVFESTPVAGPNEWGPPQARRIRYFKKPKAADDE